MANTEHEDLLKRARTLLMSIAWTHTVLARAAATVTVCVMPANLDINTACVDARGRIFLAPKFFAGLNAAEACFVLAHEILHVLFQHFGRQGSREHARWNRSADRAINHSLKLMGMTPLSFALLPLPGTPENASAEELYELEPVDDGGGGGDGAPMPTAGCGVLAPQGESETDEDRAAVQQAAAVWRQVAIETASAARTAGKTELGALIKLLKIPPARVRWGDLLRSTLNGAIAGAGRDDVSWSRKSRRGAALGCVLPGGVTTRAAIAVIIDASGSVDDQALSQAIAETCSAVTASGCAAYLAVHDAAITWEGWIRPGASAHKVAAECLKGRGGTLFEPAYDAVAAVSRGRFGTVIHLTDGYPGDVWPDKPGNCRKAIVGLIGLSTPEYVPGYARIVMIEPLR